MNIIKIGNEAMKISLCTSEAKELGFDCGQSEETMKSSFLKLLIRAKEQIDYAVLDKRITGEIFTGKDGGCEIFVSRAEVHENVYKDRCLQDTAKNQRPFLSIYTFDTLDKLLAVTKRLSEICYAKESAVYYDEVKEKYYIILEDVSTKELRYAFILEYGTQVKVALYQHIKEHLKCVCKKDGVKSLCQC